MAPPRVWEWSERPHKGAAGSELVEGPGATWISEELDETAAADKRVAFLVWDACNICHM